MIADILQRSFVTKFGNQLAQTFASRGERRRSAGNSPAGAEELNEVDFAVAEEELRRVLTAEVGTSSGQPGFDLPPDEHPAGARPLDDVAYVSREPVMGNLQSAIEEFYEERHDDQIEGGDSNTRRGGGGGGDAVTDRRLVRTPDRGGRRLFRRFEQTDARWIECLFAMAIKKFKGPHAFNETPTRVELPGDNATLFLVGDWGSGVPRARQVADKMRALMSQPATAPRHAIHLGDIYYSGTKRECSNRFLNFWPVKPEWASSIPSWNLMGNHDMYSGGYGFYDTVLADPRFALQNKSSQFVLSNKSWRILGLDTASEDEALKNPQPAWIAQEVLLARQQGQKVLFLSHHQLFSAYEKGCPNIAKALGPILNGGGIDAWFWGHEHRCVLYKAGEGVRWGRCLGHGGVPVWQTHKAPAEKPYPDNVIYEYRDAIQKGVERFAKFGFATLELTGGDITVRYITEDGVEDRKETIT